MNEFALKDSLAQLLEAASAEHQRLFQGVFPCEQVTYGDPSQSGPLLRSLRKQYKSMHTPIPVLAQLDCPTPKTSSASLVPAHSRDDSVWDVNRLRAELGLGAFGQQGAAGT